MSVFRANNGIVIHDHGTHVSWASGFSHPFVTEALREYFQAERDEKLGLWRWPENPKYVVKMAAKYEICVIHEPEFWRKNTVHFTDARALAEFMHEEPGKHTKPWRKAARAYLKEHPIKQPWHEIEPGQVWVLTIDGKETPAIVTGGLAGPYFLGEKTNYARTNAGITNGRRIWPEGDDDE